MLDDWAGIQLVYNSSSVMKFLGSYKDHTDKPYGQVEKFHGWRGLSFCINVYINYQYFSWTIFI